MTNSQSKSFQIRLDSLPVVYAALVEVLGKSEFSGAELENLISNHVSGECVLCGILVNGGDLNKTALAHDVEELSDARLARLKQGYCCRRTCDSYYYNLVFAPVASVNWEKIIGHLNGVATHAATAESRDRSDRGRTDPARRRLQLKIAAGVGLVLIIFLIKHFMSGGSLPGVHREPKYRVDPASVPAPPPR